jgi:hypothetical protein
MWKLTCERLVRIWNQKPSLLIYFAACRKMIHESDKIILETELPRYVQPLLVAPLCDPLTMGCEPSPDVTNQEMIEIISLRDSAKLDQSFEGKSLW